MQINNPKQNHNQDKNKDKNNNQGDSKEHSYGRQGNDQSQGQCHDRFYAQGRKSS